MADKFFEFYSPVKIIAGDGALEHLAFELLARGVSRPLIVTDAGVRAVGLVEPPTGALESGGVTVAAVFDAVPVDSSTATVAAVAACYRANECDCIIAIGGGSVIDSAKTANILATEGGDDVRAHAGAYTLKRRLAPLFVIPTTSGTGSEVTSVAVVRDEKIGTKLPFVSQFLMPDVAVLDARMTLALPAGLTAATAMDAMTHSIEAFTCLAKNPLSDAYATAAISKISQNLLRAVTTPKDQHARLELAVAATMAGVAFSNSMVGLVHSLGHSVGALAHLPHGLCMNVLLPYVLEFNLPVRAELIGDLLRPLAGDDVFAATPREQRAAAAISRIRTLRDHLHRDAGLPRTLQETGKVRRDQLSQIAAMALDDGSLLLNPRTVNHAEALSVLERAWG
jgi:alcohol dehydrogenase